MSVPSLQPRQPFRGVFIELLKLSLPTPYLRNCDRLSVCLQAETAYFESAGTGMTWHMKSTFSKYSLTAVKEADMVDSIQMSGP